MGDERDGQAVGGRSVPLDAPRHTRFTRRSTERTWATTAITTKGSSDGQARVVDDLAALVGVGPQDRRASAAGWARTSWASPHRARLLRGRPGGLELAYLNGAVTALWPPVGVGLAILLLFGLRSGRAS